MNELPHSESMETALPIVGIGASAGGLEALQVLVAAIPPDSGMAYVIVQHLAPNHPSILDQLLATHAHVPVQPIREDMACEANRIYVIPAGPSVTLDGRHFRLHPRAATPGPVRTPIDRFFTSLAEAAGADAFAVVLSGTGSDGTAGIRDIKAVGGTVLAQQSASARFPSMPESATATGLVDIVLKPDEIPARLLDIQQYRRRLRGRDDSAHLREELDARLSEILALIDEPDGHDFSRYKRGTLLRRTERRMALLRMSTVGGLLDRLAADPGERALLRQDFLIGVTRLFRDPAAFDTLRREAIADLVGSDRTTLRIWVPGCSTGEEVYTIAMLLDEALSEADDERPWQVFGTDLDTAALLHARAASYGEHVVAELADERRQRYFQHVETGWQVSPRLREHCIFAPHNLLSDPPFSRLDLISCRNLMIYLTSEVQETIFPRFHYALNPGGWLFLGPSESPGRNDGYFSTVDRESRLYRRIDSVTSSYSALNSLDGNRRLRGGARPGGATRPAARAVAAAPEPSFAQQVGDYFLQHTAPPFAVVNVNDDVVYLSESMGSHVWPSTGLVSAHVDDFLDRDLRGPVGELLAAIRSGLESDTRSGIPVSAAIGGQSHVDIHAHRLPFAGDHVMLTLQPVRLAPDATEVRQEPAMDDTGSRMSQLEHELSIARRQLERLRITHQDNEQALRRSNEELLSMNEELQSSNEELETNREELQSINEELETVNAELAENNRRLIETNSDLRNLFESTAIATLFLDQSMCVRRYTPATTRLFSIQERDLGRPIREIAWKIHYDRLEEDAVEVARTLTPIEREVHDIESGEIYQMRIRAYRRTDDRIDGCVLTFVDITERKRQEQRLAEAARQLHVQYTELEALYDQAPIGLCLNDREYRWIRINEQLAAMFGHSMSEFIGRSQRELMPDLFARTESAQREVFESARPVLGVAVSGSSDNEVSQQREFIVDFYPVKDDQGVIAVGSCWRDVTAEKTLQGQLAQTMSSLQEGEARLKRLFDSAPAYIALFEGPRHKYIYTNPRNSVLSGRDNLVGEYLAEAFPEFVEQGIVKLFDAVYTTGQPQLSSEVPVRLSSRPGGEVRDIIINRVLQPWFDAAGNTGGIMAFAVDITEQVQAREGARTAERQLARSEAALSASLRAGRIGTYEYEPLGRELKLDAAARGLWGFTPDETLDVSDVVGCIHPEDREWFSGEFERMIEAGGDGRHDIEYRVQPRDGTGRRWVHACGERTRIPGEGDRIIGVVRDVTDRRRAMEGQSILLHELQHRVKNSMAITLAIVQLSAQKATDVMDYTHMLGERLQALARTHDLLFNSEWTSGQLREIVSAELDAFAGEDGLGIRFTGPNVRLSSKQLVTLALALHELATNATKYGSLSVPGGYVTLDATFDDGILTLTWQEHGGPPVESPVLEDEGFGTFLLQDVLSSDIDGEVSLNFPPGGVVCTMSMPLQTGESGD